MIKHHQVRKVSRSSKLWQSVQMKMKKRNGETYVQVTITDKNGLVHVRNGVYKKTTNEVVFNYRTRKYRLKVR